MFNPFKWLSLLRKRIWHYMSKKEVYNEVTDILDNCTEVLNEKGYYTVGQKYTLTETDNHKSVRVDLHFNECIDTFPITLKNAQIEKIGHETLLKTGTPNYVGCLREKALELFVWSCYLPKVGSDKYWQLMKEREVLCY